MDKHAEHINPKLIRSLRIFFVISVVVLVIVIYDIIRDHASVWQVLLGLIAGIVAGVVFTRMYKISWDKDAEHATSRIDIYGAVVLVLYIIFDLSRSHLVHLFTYNQSAPAISLALLSGAMYGRVLGSGHVIVRLLREQGLFPVRRKT